MNREEWNERWSSPEWDTGTEPHDLLVGEVDGLPPGAALDLACGNGRDAVWLAGLGWRVTAVDWSRTALDMARALAEERGVPVTWIDADLLTWTPPEAAFDLVTIMYLHLPPDERRALLRAASAALRPGGTLVVVGYDRSHTGCRWQNMRDPARLLAADELVAELSGLRVVKAERLEIERPSPEGPRTAVEVVVTARRS